MSKREIIERERRWAMPAFIACAAAVVLFVAAVLVQRSAELTTDAGSAVQLKEFAENNTAFLASAVLQALAVGLLAAPLLYLFRAAQARNEAVRAALVGIVVVGPLFFAAGGIVQTIGFDQVASDFALQETECAEDTGSAQDDCVDEIIRSDAMVSTGGGLSLAGTLGLLAGLVYTSLQAMRAGLLTRFMGTLGMALGVAVLLFGPIGPPAVVIYVLSLGLLFIDRWPSGRPPAWDEGRAIPWPKPGEAPPAEQEEEQPAEIEGSAEEIFEEPSVEDIASEGRRRKRKRRG